ncbi:hypothetical protein SZ53_01515, partial [Brachyspira hyodysenteriae]
SIFLLFFFPPQKEPKSANVKLVLNHTNFVLHVILSSNIAFRHRQAVPAPHRRGLLLWQYHRQLHTVMWTGTTVCFAANPQI